MTPVDKMLGELEAVEREVEQTPKPDSMNSLLDRVLRHVRRVEAMLRSDEGTWISTGKAAELLGVRSINTVKTWAKHGLLDQRLKNGRVQVSLDSVLRVKQENEDLQLPDAPLTEDDMAVIARTRPGSLPWQRKES